MTLLTLPLWILNSILGIALLAFVLTNLAAPEFTVSTRLEGVLSPVVGLVGGFLMGVTNVGGPAFAMYLYSLKLFKRDFIKSIAAIFIVNKLAQLASFHSLNMMTLGTIGLSLFVLMFILLGFYLGLKTQDRVNQRTFNRGLLALLSVMGLVLIVRAFTSP